jgi:hypothetical protein
MIFEPFGGLVILLVIAVTLIVGLIVAIAGRKSKRTVAVGVLIVAAPWMLLMLLMMLSPHEIDEWNPAIGSDTDVIGKWTTDGYLIAIRPDSSFEATIQGISLKGSWRRMDWNLYLTDSNGAERYMRFVHDSGDLILLPNPPVDDDFVPGPMAIKRSEQDARGNRR